MHRDLARILDANFNRAREGLRVAEEFARFVVEDAALAEQARQFRHDLAGIAARLDPTGRLLVEARDTAGDVGTAAQTTSPASRQSANEVATAAAKRVGEALRVLCEYAKAAGSVPVRSSGGGEGTPYGVTTNSSEALPTDKMNPIPVELDRMRYRFYDWEKSLAGAADRGRIRRAGLYLLLTQSACRDRAWKAAARAAIDGGADVIQLREKDLPDSERLDRAAWLAELCREANVLCVVNDRPDIARLAGADGVHVGQADLPIAAVREIIKPSQFVGVSTHSPEQLAAAITAGPDYIALGPAFATSTKPDYAVAGIETVRAGVARLAELNIPHVAVGGITLGNVRQLVEAGVRCVAVCSAILSAEDIALACQQFKQALAR